MKTQCQTIEKYNPDGTRNLKYKRSYNTLDEAIMKCKELNSRSSQIRKLVSYKCNICHKYHIGRGKTLLTNEGGKRKNNGIIKTDIPKVLYQLEGTNTTLKIIGKIDLGAVDKKYKDQ